MTFTTGDTAPPLVGVCQQVKGTACGQAPLSTATAVDLSGAIVELHIDYGAGVPLVKLANVVSAPAGEWSYDWGPNDLTVAGVYVVEAQVTYGDGRVQTFGPTSFRVKPQIG